MFFSHLAQTFSPLIFSLLAKNLGAVNNARIYGYLVLGAVSLGYLSSNLFYYKAGRAYKKIQERKEAGELVFAT